MYAKKAVTIPDSHVIPPTMIALFAIEWNNELKKTALISKIITVGTDNSNILLLIFGDSSAFFSVTI